MYILQYEGNIADLHVLSSQHTSHKHGAVAYVRFIAVNATPTALTTHEIEEAEKL